MYLLTQSQSNIACATQRNRNAIAQCIRNRTQSQHVARDPETIACNISLSGERWQTTLSPSARHRHRRRHRRRQAGEEEEEEEAVERGGITAMGLREEVVVADTTAVDMAVEVGVDTTVVAAEAIAAAAAGVAGDPTIGATGTRTTAAAAATPATWQRMRP